MTSTTTDRLAGVTASLGVKAPVRASTTANITLSGEQTIDGVAVVADDRVLVKNQTDGTENGIYDCKSGAWVRSLDFDGTRDVVSGTAVIIADGTAGAGTIWYLSTTGDITIGTTSLTFTQLTVASASAFAQTLLDDADAATARATLGITNTTTTRGDMIRGDASGDPERLPLGVAGEAVVSDGTDAIFERPRAAVTGASKGLIVTNNSGAAASQVDIDADEIVLKTTDGGPAKVVSSVNLTVDITASGANGLDTGVEANSTWYYTWVIWNPTTDTTAGLLSLSTTSPTMPAGYTYKAFVSAVFNDSSGDFRNFWQNGKNVWSKEGSTGWTALSGGSAVAITSVDLSSYVPPIAVEVDVNLNLTTPGSAGIVTSVVRNENGGASYNKLGVTAIAYDATARAFNLSGRMPLTTAQTVYYLNTAASSALNIQVLGFKLP